MSALMSPLKFGASLVDSRLLIQHARLAEKHGFDFVAVGEHLMRHTPGGPTLSALPALAAAAGATTRLGLLSSVVIAPLHNPVRLAKDAAVVDVISGGRLTLGLGIGGEFPREFELAGVPVIERGGRTDESIPLLRRLWMEREVDHIGHHFKVNNVTLDPSPAQQGGPAIWVGGRTDAAVSRSVRFGDGWIPYLFTPEQYEVSVRKVIKGFESSQSRTGSDHPNRAELISIDPSKQISDGTRPFAWGLHLMTTLRTTYEEALVDTASSLSLAYRYGGDYAHLAARYTLLGNPDDCLEMLRMFVKAGARHILLAWQGDPDRVCDQIAQAGEELLPVARCITA